MKKGCSTERKEQKRKEQNKNKSFERPCMLLRFKNKKTKKKRRKKEKKKEHRSISCQLVNVPVYFLCRTCQLLE